MTDLQQIDGIGPSYADELAAHDFEDAEAVADADPEEIDEIVDGIDGDAIVDSAAVTIEADEVDGDGDDGVFEIDPEFDDDQRNHLIRALVTQEVQARRRNDPSRAEAIRDAIDQVIEGPPYEMSMEQLDAAYTGSNQLEAEYRGTRGLGAFTTKIRGIRDAFKDARQDNWD